MKLSNLLSLIMLVPQLFKLVDDAVQSVESSLGQIPGITGGQKLAAAEAKIAAVMSTVGADIQALVSVTGILTPLINATVSIFNTSGVFSKSPPAPTA